MSSNRGHAIRVPQHSNTMKLLSRAEELCLLSVRMHDGQAYGASIRNHLIDATETDWSIGVVYQTLDRMAGRGLLSTHVGAPTAERGGRSKKIYRLTKEGIQALAIIRAIQQDMWRDLKDAGLDIPAFGSTS